MTLATLEEGTWTVTVTNSTHTATLQITIDTVIPVLTTAPALTGAAADGYINDAEKAGTAALVTAPTATDAAAITTTYAVLGNTGVCDSTTTTAATVPTPATLTTDGIYRICARISDTAGNAIHAATPTLTRDTVVPALTLQTGHAGGIVKDGTTYLSAGDTLILSLTAPEALQPATVTGTLTIAGTDQAVTLTRSGSAFTYRYTVPSDINTDTITLAVSEASITDLAGNAAEEEPDHTITNIILDAIAPVLTVSPFVVSEGAGSVTATVTDTRPDTDSYLYRIVSDDDDCSASTGGESFTSGTAIAVDPSSSGYLCVQARDLAGNTTTIARDLSVQVPPKVTFISSLGQTESSGGFQSPIITAQVDTGTHPHGYLLTDMVFDLAAAFAASENNILEVQVEKGCSLTIAENERFTTFTIAHADLETDGVKALTIPDNTVLAPDTCYTFVFTYTNTDSTTMGRYQAVTGYTPDTVSQDDWGDLHELIIRRNGVSHINPSQKSLKVALRGHLLLEPSVKRRSSSGVGLVKRTGSSLGHLADFFIDPLRDLTKQVYHFGRDLALGSSGEDVRQLKLFLEQQNRIAAEPAAFEEVVYRLGDSHPDIKEAQELLNQTTCPVATTGSGSPGQETEYFGSLTRQAVLCFQQEHNLPITATITSTLLETLMRHTAPSPFTSTETEYDDRQDETDVYVEYRLGDSHPDIKEAQELLNQTTCPVAATGSGSPGQETEYFGSLTRQAVLCFQQEHNLPITATITSTLLETLRRHTAPSPFTSTETEYDDRQDETDVYVEYRLGDSHPDIKEAQELLNQTTCPVAATGLGSPGQETEYFDSLTRQAVLCFQREHNLPITATITSTLLETLRRHTAPSPFTSTETEYDDRSNDDAGGDDSGNDGGDDQGNDNQGADDGAFTRDLGVGSSGEEVRLLNLFLEQQNTPLNTENNTPAPITPLNAVQRPRSFVAPSF